MSGTDNPFLGRGWAFPPRFSPGGDDVATVAGEDDVHQSLAILFATERGERVMQPEYGAGLRPLLFAEVDQALIASLRDTVSTAVLFHEPRVALNSVTVAPDPATPGLLSITINYTILGTNSRYNFVFPFYIREATGNG